MGIDKLLFGSSSIGKALQSEMHAVAELSVGEGTSRLMVLSLEKWWTVRLFMLAEIIAADEWFPERLDMVVDKVVSRYVLDSSVQEAQLSLIAAGVQNEQGEDLLLTLRNVLVANLKFMAGQLSQRRNRSS